MWDEKQDCPFIDTYQGQKSELTIEFHEDGRCVAGFAMKWTGKWEIRDTKDHPFLYLLFGNEDDDLAITVRITEEAMVLGKRPYRKRTDLRPRPPSPREPRIPPLLRRLLIDPLITFRDVWGPKTDDL